MPKTISSSALARLAEPRTRTGGDGDEVPLSPLALPHCFDRLAGDLDGIVRAAHWPGGAAGA
ncbi:hypothetical protein [Lysobacter niastensis]|uniref:XAC0095-like domain-containing protein n=1 Tax=Lysobacter niastensis TaxID=380629 RepID=A0ABS0B4C0_9GAMM|nr:hypothetical protein [Lysobacter niastensis]MBF6023439.1 hypothetical protein [Lysobacter niastensis]